MLGSADSSAASGTASAALVTVSAAAVVEEAAAFGGLRFTPPTSTIVNKRITITVRTLTEHVFFDVPMIVALKFKKLNVHVTKSAHYLTYSV